MAFDPGARSSDFATMAPFWRMVTDILGGADVMRKARESYLPRYDTESDDDYAARVKIAPWTPLYDQAVRNIVAKPFEKEVSLVDGSSSERVDQLTENIDGQGNHLFVFAREVFRNAIDYGVDFIFVDFPRALPGATLADERSSGARPLWYRIPAERMLALYDAQVADGSTLIHARIDESMTEIVDREEKHFVRVRVIERPLLKSGQYGSPQWELWERAEDSGGWRVIDQGQMTIAEIPIVPMLTGERKDGSWVIRPPMRDLAYMQITEFQMASGRAWVQQMTAFPMLTVIGMDNDDSKNIIGPRRMLFVPPNGDGMTPDVRWLEPSGSAGTMLREDLEAHRSEMREAGLQPLLPRSGNITATAHALAQAKAHSAVQTWALGLKDALEQAFVFTAQWLGEDIEPEVSVFTDFDVETNSVEGMQIILAMHAAPDPILSREAVITEAKRRKILSPEYDGDEDLKKILEEMEDAEPATPELGGMPTLFTPQQSGMDEE